MRISTTAKRCRCQAFLISREGGFSNLLENMQNAAHQFLIAPYGSSTASTIKSSGSPEPAHAGSMADPFHPRRPCHGGASRRLPREEGFSDRRFANPWAGGFFTIAAPYSEAPRSFSQTTVAAGTAEAAVIGDGSVRRGRIPECGRADRAIRASGFLRPVSIETHPPAAEAP